MNDPIQKVQEALDALHYDGKIIHSDATIFTVDDASRGRTKSTRARLSA